MKLFDWIKGKKGTPFANKAKSPNTLANRFSFHLMKCCDILRQANSGYTHDDEYDLYAIAYVISDFAVYAANKNRTKSSKIILDLLMGKLAVRYPNESLDFFRSRIDFYSKVVQGMQLHGHCLPGVDLSDSNPITSCAIAFCDCLMNPMYISDYNDYWPPMFDAIDAYHVATEVMQPLNSELVALYNDMYTYAL